MFPRVHAPCRRLVHPEVEHDAVPNAATRGGLHVSMQIAARHDPCFPQEPSWPGFAVPISRSVWQAEEAVANLPLLLAVRVHCGHQACDGRRERNSTGTLGVLTA